MATFSIGEAAKAGFRIVREQRKAILAWSLAYFVIVLLPQVGGLMLTLPEIMRATEEAARVAGPEGPTQAEIQAAMGMEGTVVLLQIVQFVTVMLWAMLFYGAVYRVVLEPENTPRWYMRLGAQELRLAAVSAVASVMFIIVALVIFLPAMVLFGAFSSANGGASPVAVLLAVGLGVLVYGLFVWVGIRLSLAYPMTFAERRFMLFESWAVTRGHAWRMFLTYLAAFGWALLVVLGFMLVIWVLAFIGVLGFAGFAMLTEGANPITAAGDIPASLKMLAVLALLALSVLMAVMTTVAYTLMVAPSAAIYQRLREPPAPAQAA